MIKVFTNIFIKKSPINFYQTSILHNNFQCQFATFTDKLQKRQSQKTEQQIKKQIEHLANKPTFTLMDYKQRILDELNKLKSSLRAKMNTQTQQQQKQLEVQKKVLSSLYEGQLNEQTPLKFTQKRAISLVSQVDYAKVCDIFKKVERYKKMHSLLRGMKQRQQPLPKDMAELNYMYVKSGLQFQGPKQKYLRYQSRSRIERGRYMKWKRGE